MIGMEVDFSMALEYYAKGFEDCAELAEDLVLEAKNLDKAQADIKKLLLTLKEQKIRELRERLHL
jgi:hypothetical protein